MASCLCISYSVLCVAGLLLSAYAVYIEQAKMKDKDYVAFCDINEAVSCTSVLTSEYSIGLGIVGKLLGENSILNVPTAYYGCVLYSLLLLLSFSASKISIGIQLCLNVVSMAASIGLMYILMFEMHKTCMVCYGIHVVNTLLLITVLLRTKRCCSDGASKKQTKKKKTN